MKRDLTQLANKEYDVLIIGCGIYGACVAWDATLRGLSVALIDKGDFGSATSANSLKIIHGGLRYLQDANLKLMRTMIYERTTWMRIAPHLVHPLPCLMPTSKKKFTRNKLAMSTALWMNDLVSYDRNQDMDIQKHLPNGRIISRTECLKLLPGMKSDNLNGGAIWYDAQMYNSERLLLSFVLAATEAGADAANYVEMVDFLKDESRVIGAKVKDVLTNEPFDIRAKLVVNCAGSWVDSILGFLNNRATKPKFRLSVAMNLVTRQLLTTHAVGVSNGYNGNGHSASQSQMFFIVPWHQYSLIGTIHIPYAGKPQDLQITEGAVQSFINEINLAYPDAALTLEDVYHVHAGFLPMVKPNGSANSVKLVRESRIYDHEHEDNIPGLITVVGVKYTTARVVAKKVVNLAIKKLGYNTRPCQTHETPIYGGRIERFADFLVQALKQRPIGLGHDITQHLVYNYGSEYPQLLNYFDEDPAWAETCSKSSPVTKVEIIHAIGEEMAVKLTDVIQRRTELGAAGLPDETSLQICADIMAAELGWNRARREQEICDVISAYPLTGILAQEKIGVN